MSLLWLSFVCRRDRSQRPLPADDLGSRTSGQRRRGTVLPAVISAAFVIVAAAGCTKDAPPPPAPAPTPAPTATSKPAPASRDLTVSLEADGLSSAGKATMTKAVGSLVGGWLEAAYLAGPVGAKPGSDRFPGFTSGAARSAANHPRQLTNAALGAKAKGLVATARTVKASAYVSEKRAHGVVADVSMTASSPRAKLTVRGNVYLTRVDLTRAGGTWRIFGYDITTATS